MMLALKAKQLYIKRKIAAIIILGTIIILPALLFPGTLRIESSLTWKSYDTVPPAQHPGCPTDTNFSPDWTQVGYDDSNWRNATSANFPPQNGVDLSLNIPMIWDWPGPGPYEPYNGPIENFLRYPFTFYGQIISAHARLSVDDNFQLYINGVLVFEDDGDGAGVVPPLTEPPFDIAPYLTQGENIIAIRAWDGNNCVMRDRIAESVAFLAEIEYNMFVINPIPDVITDGTAYDSLFKDLNNVFYDNEDGSALDFSIESNSNTSVLTVEINIDSALVLHFSNSNDGDSSIVVVKAEDKDSNSATDTFVVRVIKPDNSPYVVNPIPDVITDGTAYDSLFKDLNNVFYDTEDGSALDFSIESNSDTTILTVGINIDSALALHFKPYNFNNSSVIIVKAVDDNESSVKDTFIVRVIYINKQPLLTIKYPEKILEDSQEHTIDLTDIDDGDSGLDQNISVYVESMNKSIINNFNINYTSGDKTGSIAFTPEPDAFGLANIRILIKDDGGIDNNGIDSVLSEINIDVLPVNDEPSFSLYNDSLEIDSNNNNVLIDTLWAFTIKPGPDNEMNQLLQFHVYTANSTFFNSPPSIDSTTGILTLEPNRNMEGQPELFVFLTDNGGIENNGDDTSDTLSFFVLFTIPENIKITVLGPQTLLNCDIPQKLLADNVSIKKGIAIQVDFLADIELYKEKIKCKISIFDATGNLIDTCNSINSLNNNIQMGFVSGFPTTRLIIYWNGTNKNGRFVGNGTYLANINVIDCWGRNFNENKYIGIKAINTLENFKFKIGH